ncbi:hypothetical protein [Nocardia cyriacigeorgica]|uniref:Uncharacterized protein n=1 Tax=Nocardia cyriacigeorgica (strain GUH-2) TaxID=1127134 RepID=H6QYA5_NOCCG|nr:hypothetical protein [Nocardia cyriacigeorgica]CCF62751.1 protein of unknown function [Nocardia cyriacigeorgica GUH-2]
MPSTSPLRPGDSLSSDRGEASERPDLTAWRKRHALRSSNAARPLPNKRRYRRERKHAKADY